MKFYRWINQWSRSITWSYEAFPVEHCSLVHVAMGHSVTSTRVVLPLRNDGWSVRSIVDHVTYWAAPHVWTKCYQHAWPCSATIRLLHAVTARWSQHDVWRRRKAVIHPVREISQTGCSVPCQRQARSVAVSQFRKSTYITTWLHAWLLTAIHYHENWFWRVVTVHLSTVLSASSQTFACCHCLR